MDNTINEVSQVLHQFEEAVEKFDGKCIVQNIQTSPISADSKMPYEVLQIIQDVMVNLNLSKDDEEPNLAILPALDNIEKLCITSQSIVHYILCLDTIHSNYIFKWMYNETITWLSDLFRFKEYDAVIDDNVRDSIAMIFRVILSRKYPSYSDEGYRSFIKEPVIYADDSSMLFANYICRNCGLPLCCARKVVLHDSSQDSLNLLQRMFENDVNNGKIPIMAIIEAETKIIPNHTIVKSFQKFCAQNKIWLHLNGSLLASLPILPNPKHGNEDDFIADSISVRLGPWLNIPALQTTTLYRKFKTDDDKYWDTFIPSRNIANSLPIWTILQCLGSDEFKNRFELKFDACYRLYFKLRTFECLKLLSQPPADESGDMTVTGIVTENKPDDVMEHLITSVTFKFVPDREDMWSSNYCDKLNSWLNQVLSRELPEVRTNVVRLENERLALQYCPFESTSIPDEAVWNNFYSCLEQQLDVLKSTVAQKTVLYSLLDESSNLKIVELQDWAGLGGVRYIPQGWDQIITDHAKNELNRLNIQIVNQLRNTDAAFSFGEGDDGLVCIRLGMIDSDSDVSDLVSLVETIGKQEEDSWNFIDTMAEVVKKGIQTATVDLQKENEDKLWQEGILRHVPVFGNLVNWWSPIPKENDVIKGRSFDLNAGVISSTENIYRYHVQQPLPLLSSSVTDESSNVDVFDGNVVEIPVTLPNRKNSVLNYSSDILPNNSGV